MSGSARDAQAVEITDFESLVAHARDGSEAAWESLFHAHHDYVYRVARRLGTPTADLDDVVQQTFLVVFRKLDAFHHGRFTTWLYRITANVVSEHHRRHRVRSGFLRILGWQPQSESISPEAHLAGREAEAAVNGILAAMAPKKREVFVLYELDGLGGEEIALLVGCKLETVWTRLHHARREFTRLARRRHVIEESGG